jgi:hypothetical protein
MFISEQVPLVSPPKTKVRTNVRTRVLNLYFIKQPLALAIPVQAGAEAPAWVESPATESQPELRKAVPPSEMAAAE